MASTLLEQTRSASPHAVHADDAFHAGDCVAPVTQFSKNRSALLLKVVKVTCRCYGSAVLGFACVASCLCVAARPGKAQPVSCYTRSSLTTVGWARRARGVRAPGAADRAGLPLRRQGPCRAPGAGAPRAEDAGPSPGAGRKASAPHTAAVLPALPLAAQVPIVELGLVLPQALLHYSTFLSL